jgi:hypothetical protein
MTRIISKLYSEYSRRSLIKYVFFIKEMLIGTEWGHSFKMKTASGGALVAPPAWRVAIY